MGESYNKGYDVSGTQQQVDDIYNKYAEVRKIQY